MLVWRWLLEHGGEGTPLGQCVCVYGAFLCGWVHVSVMCCVYVLDEGWMEQKRTIHGGCSHSELTPLLDSWTPVDMRAGESSSNPNFATFQLCSLNSLSPFPRLCFLIYRTGITTLAASRAHMEMTLGRCPESCSLWGEGMRKEFPLSAALELLITGMHHTDYKKDIRKSHLCSGTLPGCPWFCWAMPMVDTARA